MIKTALYKTANLQNATTVAGAALPALFTLANHKRMKDAERDDLHDPKDPNINQNAAKAYKKQRNRIAMGGAIGSTVGHLLSKKYPIASHDDEDSASAETALKMLASSLGSQIGKMTMSKKDREDIAKYRLHDNIRHQFRMRGKNPTFEYTKDDSEKGLDISTSKRRNIVAKIKQAKERE